MKNSLLFFIKKLPSYKKLPTDVGNFFCVIFYFIL